ncbi:hypothetical protein TRP8649_03615 [Pelagimonas phthalicica]|uniref:Uncharacterized protein n=1 Tax=Pelagimonas phthalicica TaxID=1037362 RepID=A0A238JFQ0_9RHOB|nr:hypothetical protein [Pelagimonas phthalicica]TDS92418.1 hypothetical protein CLV87_3613 [Pelagimonas phthalicica]SMX29479.1 hypothetical protein TRP8649_03615 [Pelagimonas phthalicica]
MTVKSLLFAAAVQIHFASIAIAEVTNPLVDNLADLMIDVIEREYALQSPDIVPQPSPKLDPVAEMGLAPFSENGRTVQVAVAREISPETLILLPDVADCDKLGPWFVGLSFKRDYSAFFAQSEGRLRLCSQANSGWVSVRTKKGTVAHLLLKLQE